MNSEQQCCPVCGNKYSFFEKMMQPTMCNACWKTHKKNKVKSTKLKTNIFLILLILFITVCLALLMAFMATSYAEEFFRVLLCISGGYALLMIIVAYFNKAIKCDWMIFGGILGIIFLIVAIWLSSSVVEAWCGGGGYENWMTSMGEGDTFMKSFGSIGVLIAFTGSMYLFAFLPFISENNFSISAKIIGIIGIILFSYTFIMYIINRFLTYI